MRLTWATTILCLSAFPAACRTTDSRVLHDTDHPTADKDSWVELSRDEYLRFDIPLVEGKDFQPSSLLPDDHVLAKRAQHWMDLIDQTLRQKYPEQLAGVPHPRAGVLVKKVDNAHASVATTCSPVILRLSSAATTTAADLGILGPVKDGDTMVLGELTDADCVLRPLTPAFLKNLTTTAGGDDCAIKYAADSSASRPILFLDRPCALLSPKLAGKEASAAKGAATFLTSNWLTFYTHIFTITHDEREFVAILAHELGHYYRAHTVSESVNFDFFYTVADNSLGRRPVEDPSLAELGAKVLEVSKRLESSDFVYVDEAGYSLGLALYFPAFGITIQSTKLCKDDASCQKDCEAFAKMAQPKDNPKSSAQSYNHAFMTCANHIPFTVGVGKTLFDDAPLKDLATSLQKIPGVEALVQATIAKNPTWGAVLRDLNDFVLASVKPEQAVLAQAAAQDLGFYTTEQEADELSAEWLALIGIDPVYAARAYLDLFVAEGGSGIKGTNVAFSSPSQKICQALYKQGWKDATGAPIFLPIGDYGEPHHNTCYRAWNIDREIRGHKYQVAAPPTIPAPAWSQIMETAAALTPLTFLAIPHLSFDGLDA